MMKNGCVRTGIKKFARLKLSRTLRNQSSCFKLLVASRLAPREAVHFSLVGLGIYSLAEIQPRAHPQQQREYSRP